MLIRDVYLHMSLKEKATKAYSELAGLHDNRSGYTPETQSYFVSDVLSDLADAAREEGCEIVVPDAPSSMQAINVVTEVLDWLRETDDLF